MQQWLSKNYFELFGLPVNYTVDQQQLVNQYRQLQKHIHPDNFAGSTDQEKLLSVQLTAYINEAYGTLRSPLKKALYLLNLQGIDVNSENTTINDLGFLQEQMMLREELSEISTASDPEQQLEVINEQIQVALEKYEQQLSEKISCNHLDKDFLVATVQKLQFMTKLQQEVEEMESELLDD